MSDEAASDALQEQVEEAQRSGDTAKANELYQKQLGNEAALVPAVVGVDAETDSAGDETLPAVGPPPEGEWTFARPEVVAHQFAMMEADFGELATELRSEWGADAGRNLEFAFAASREFEAHYPEVVSTLARRGAGADPLIVELLAVLGRQWAETPGDPMTVRLFPNADGHGQERNMSEIDAENFDEKTEALMGEEAEARAAGNFGKSKRLEREIRALFVKKYGTGPVVGSSGGPPA